MTAGCNCFQLHPFYLAAYNPRCCKRDSYLSVLSAVDFVKEHFGVEMEKQEIRCEFCNKNNQCLGERCPFSGR